MWVLVSVRVVTAQHHGIKLSYPAPAGYKLLYLLSPGSVPGTV